MNDDPARVVTFALPDESHPLVRAMTSRRLLRFGDEPMLPTWMGRYGGRLLAVVHTGVGDTPSGRLRLHSVLAGAEDLRWVVSAGYAGALSPKLRVGDLVLGRNYSDPILLAAARDALADQKPHVGDLITRVEAAETVEAKAALARETGGLAVDMETGWIDEICAEAGVPLLSLRVVSDAADQPFPVPGHVLFDAARQRPRYVALPAYLLLHPSRIAPFVHFVRGLTTARARLAHALAMLIRDLP